MTALITKVSAARKAYPCSWDCGSDIDPGQAYIRWAIPPHTPPNDGGENWWTGAAHGMDPGECPTFIHGQPSPAMDAVEMATTRIR